MDLEYILKICLILKSISVNQSKRINFLTYNFSKIYFREAFAKLSGLSGDKRDVSVQDLFPWTLTHSQNKQYQRLKSYDSFL